MPERWMTDAACAEVDPSVFFPEPEWKSAPMAQRVCEDCPVRIKCLEFALVNNIDHGIFAGTSPKTRQKLRRMRDAS
jgi:WhiB family redox-sensing transcriptional regulator